MNSYLLASIYVRLRPPILFSKLCESHLYILTSEGNSIACWSTSKVSWGQCPTQFHTNEDLWIAYHVRPDTSIIFINHHNWSGLKHLISLTSVQTPLPQYFQTFWPYPQSSHVQKISPAVACFNKKISRISFSFDGLPSATISFQRFQPGLGATSLSYSSSILWASWHGGV